MQYAYNAAGLGDALVRSFKVGATVIAGQVVIEDTNDYGQVTDASTTAAANAFGVTLGAATYATATEANVEVVFSPFAVFKARGAGGATTGTALATTSPSNVLTQTSASTTVISAAEVGTVSFAGGTIFGLTGNNVGQSRVITSHSNSTSTTVTVAFPYSVAVGDKVVRVPWRAGIFDVQLTALLDEANAIIVAGTGIEACVVDCTIDTKVATDPVVHVYFTLREHFLNALS